MIIIILILTFKDIARLLAHKNIKIGKNGISVNEKNVKQIVFSHLNHLNKSFDLGVEYGKLNYYDRKAKDIMNNAIVPMLVGVMDAYTQIYKSKYGQQQDILNLPCYKRYEIMSKYIFGLLGKDCLVIVDKIKDNLGPEYTGWKKEQGKILMDNSFRYFAECYHDDDIIHRDLIHIQNQYLLEDYTNQIYTMIDKLKDLRLKQISRQSKIIEEKENLLKEE